MSLPEPIDLKRLSDILGEEDVKELREMLTLFIDGFPALDQDIKSALNDRNARALRNAAHAAKSASANAAAPVLTQTLRFLENQATAEDWAALDALAQAVTQEFARIEDFCQALDEKG